MSEPASRVRLALRVNGEAVELLFDGYKTLLELLREDLGLTGTKHGCELLRERARQQRLEGIHVYLPREEGNPNPTRLGKRV